MSDQHKEKLADAIKITSASQRRQAAKVKAKALEKERARQATINADKSKRMLSCRELGRMTGIPVTTWEDCLALEEKRRWGGELMGGYDYQRDREEEIERQTRFNKHEAFKECDENPHALYCDRR